MAHLIEHMNLDLRIINLSPTLGVEVTKKLFKKILRRYYCTSTRMTRIKKTHVL